jgi:D-alanyl-D-alanine carboxypeptidase
MTTLKPSILVYNATDNKVLLKTNSEIQRPIASITKLITAMVIVDDQQDLDTPVPYKNRDTRPVLDKQYDRTAFQLPEAEYTRRELLTASLVTSDNNAAETLAANYSKGYNQCIADMNTKVKLLGANDTFFNEPHGCFPDNVSTPTDLSKILLAAGQYKYLMEINNLFETTVVGTFMENVNKQLLVMFGKMIKVCKTGLSQASGYSMSILVEKNNKLYTISMLGLTSYEERTDLAKQLINQVIR